MLPPDIPYYRLHREYLSRAPWDEPAPPEAVEAYLRRKDNLMHNVNETTIPGIIAVLILLAIFVYADRRGRRQR